MMSRRRPMNLELAGPAFDLKNLSSEDQGSLEALPMCAARYEPMSRIMDHLYIGSWRDIENPDALRSEGVTHILNVAKEVDPTHHDTMEGFTSLHIPLVDEHRENIIEYIEEACRFINEAAANFGKCLVHCRRGISRSPAIVVGYLMHEKGFEYQDAVDYVKSSRKCTSLNIAFREFLMSYDVPPMRTDREQSATFDDAHDNGNAPSSGTDARFDDRASEEEDEEESSTNHGTGFEANAHAGPSSFAAAAKFEDDAPEEEDEGSAPAASCGPSLLRPFGRHDGLAVDPVLVRVGESQGSPRPV